MTTSKTRAEFEAWEKSRNGNLTRHESGMQGRWTVWQAARRATLEEAAKVLAARIMGDNNREDQEAMRCVAAIRALATEEPKP